MDFHLQLHILLQACDVYRRLALNPMVGYCLQVAMGDADPTVFVALRRSDYTNHRAEHLPID